MNYSDKSVLATFGFVNKKNQLKETVEYYVPKQFIKSIDLKSSIIEIEGWWYHKNGHLWRYRVDRAFQRPNEQNVYLHTFTDDFLKNCSLNEIKLVGF